MMISHTRMVLYDDDDRHRCTSLYDDVVMQQTKQKWCYLLWDKVALQQ